MASISLALYEIPWEKAPLTATHKKVAQALVQTLEHTTVQATEWKPILSGISKIPQPWKTLLTTIRKQMPETLPVINKKTKLPDDLQTALHAVSTPSVPIKHTGVHAGKRSRPKIIEELMRIVEKHHPPNKTPQTV